LRTALAISQRRRRRGRRQAQRLGQGQAKYLDAIAHRARHIEHRPGQPAFGGLEPAFVPPDWSALQAKIAARPADRRHRVGHQHRPAEPAQRQAQHRRRDMRTVHDQPVPGVGRLQRGRDRPRLSRGQRRHRIEQMREAGKSFGERRTRLIVACRRMAERDTNTGRRQRADKAGRHPLGCERGEGDAGKRRGEQ
jgi:hypothetical protein